MPAAIANAKQQTVPLISHRPFIEILGRSKSCPCGIGVELKPESADHLENRVKTRASFSR